MVGRTSPPSAFARSKSMKTLPTARTCRSSCAKRRAYSPVIQGFAMESGCSIDELAIKTIKTKCVCVCFHSYLKLSESVMISIIWLHTHTHIIYIYIVYFRTLYLYLFIYIYYNIYNLPITYHHPPTMRISWAFSSHTANLPSRDGDRVDLVADGWPEMNPMWYSNGSFPVYPLVN